MLRAGKGHSYVVVIASCTKLLFAEYLWRAEHLSTIRNADKIVVLSEGEIVEEGRHDDLLQKDGLYAKLVKVDADPSVLGGGTV